MESGSFATLRRGFISLKSTVLSAIDVDLCRLAGEEHDPLGIGENRGPRRRHLGRHAGTCFRVKYRKQEAPWLSVQEYGPDDPDATITLSEFRALAWAAANDKARELGWLA